MACLHDQSGSVGRLVLEVSRDHLGETVVPCETVNAGLDQDKTELRVLVLAVLLQVLAHCDSLLDEAVEVLREGWGKTLGTEDADNLVASNHLNLGNAVGIPENDANLGRSVTLLGHVADLLDSVGSALLHPRWWGTFVWECTACNTLTAMSKEHSKAT